MPGKTKGGIGLATMLAALMLLLGCTSENSDDTRKDIPPPASKEAEGAGSGPGSDSGTDSAPGCEETLHLCDGQCTDTANNLNHCGACGVRCFAGQQCQAGHCSGVGTLNPEELKQALENKDFLLLNVRMPPVGIIPGTDDSISNEDPDRLAARIGPDRKTRVVVYCRTAPRALNAIHELKARGYTGISLLAGGVTAWREAGYALE